MFNFKKMLIGVVLVVNLGCEAEASSYRDLAKFLGFATATTVVLAGRLKFNQIISPTKFNDLGSGRQSSNRHDKKVLDDSETVNVANQRSGQWVIAKLKGALRFMGFTQAFRTRL